MAVISVVEGTIPFIVNGEAFNTYHKVVGALEGRTKRPLVVLHGGPAFSHDYLIPLGDLAAFGRPVIFYDQIGSGRSAPTKDQLTTFWTMDLFIDELINLVQHLKIDDDFDVLGHSWGGILLSEFILRRGPPGLKHAVLTNTLCSTQVFGESRMQQGKAFPAWVQEEMKKGFRNTPKFREVAKIFSRVHQCRIEPQPEEFTTSVEYGFQNVHVLHSMSANELRGWSNVDRLGQITVPCLVVNGRYDTAADWTLAPFFKSIPHVKWVKFESEGSSHTPMWEDRDQYMKLVNEFLGY